jgi:hypothetical protein
VSVRMSQPSLQQEMSTYTDVKARCARIVTRLEAIATDLNALPADPRDLFIRLELLSYEGKRDRVAKIGFGQFVLAHFDPQCATSTGVCPPAACAVARRRIAEGRWARGFTGRTQREAFRGRIPAFSGRVWRR